MLFGKERMNYDRRYFLFLCRCLPQRWFYRVVQKFRGNNIIVYTSCRADQVTPRINAPISRGKTSEAITSQFTRALISVLDEGRIDYKISEIWKHLRLRFPLILGPRSFSLALVVLFVFKMY